MGLTQQNCFRSTSTRHANGRKQPANQQNPSQSLEKMSMLIAGTKGVGRRGTHSHKSKKTHKLGLRATFLERHIDQVPIRCVCFASKWFRKLCSPCWLPLKVLVR